MSDDARRAILARRSRFVAAALTGIGVACGKAAAPQPCLEVAPDATETAPMPCLSSPYVPRDAAAEEGDAGSAGPGAEALGEDAGRADAGAAGPDAGRAGAPARADAGSLAAPRPPKTKPPLAPPRPCLLFSTVPDPRLTLPDEEER